MLKGGKFWGPAKSPPDLAKSPPPYYFWSDDSAQLGYTRHSTFLHAIACTFSAAIHFDSRKSL